MDSLAGKTIVWTFDDGPMAGVRIAHDFHHDGGVTWRMVDGEHRGASRREESYAAIEVNEKTWVISYLAASGHTLTVVLNLDDGRMIGFGSNEKSRSVAHGRFELPKMTERDAQEPRPNP
jgi:MoaF N-terminal domain